jgi:hypothetical protein
MHDADASGSVRFETAWPPFEDGGLDKLAETVRKHDYRLVVVDTFSRAAPSADQNTMEVMLPIASSLQDVTKERQMSMLIVDHHNKPNQKDAQSVVDDVLGSTAKSACADCIMGLYHREGKHVAQLLITGRDIEEKELPLSWDVATCTWRCVEGEHGVRAGGLAQKVVAEVKELHASGELATTTRVADRLGKDKKQVSPILGKLVSRGILRKGEQQGKEVPYYLADTASDGRQEDTDRVDDDDGPS